MTTKNLLVFQTETIAIAVVEVVEIGAFTVIEKIDLPGSIYSAQQSFQTPQEAIDLALVKIATATKTLAPVAVNDVIHFPKAS